MESTVVQQVRRYYEMERLSQRQIAQSLQVSRKKVSNIIKAESLIKPAPESLFQPYERLVDKWYHESPFLKAAQVNDRLKSYGFTGTYGTVKLRTRTWREKHIGAPSCEDSVVLLGRWMIMLLQGRIPATNLVQELRGNLTQEDAETMIEHIRHGCLRNQNRALSVLAHLRGIPVRQIACFLMVNRHMVTRCVKEYRDQGIGNLFFSRKSTPKKHEQEVYKDALFAILHSPPMDHGINRTTWTMKELQRIMREEGLTINVHSLRKIIKDAGFRFRKAKKVLTSNDPLYREKLKEITSILSNLKPNEKFFSVDEYGPFAVKLQGGRSLTPPGQIKTVPQWQKNKGSIIITAALELSANQITYFPSPKKNSHEMIKLLEMLVDKYPEEDRLYFSWDAASWHASKMFEAKVKEINEAKYKLEKKESFVKLAPLPTRAQFLNVIESVFSGMARAIIHNSNYSSVVECIGAIDRYFLDRNQYFKKNPKRAGRKIWGEERVDAVFNESNNCKNPKYR